MVGGFDLDLVELREQIVKHRVALDWNDVAKAGAQAIEITLGEQSDGNDTILRHAAITSNSLNGGSRFASYL